MAKNVEQLFRVFGERPWHSSGRHNLLALSFQSAPRGSRRSSGRFARCNARRTQTGNSWRSITRSQDGRNECFPGMGRVGTREFASGMVDRNRCPAAARNAALQRARGEFITYLDPGDEYYPNHLAEVVAAGQESDVLFFGVRHRLRERFRRWPPDRLGPGTGHRPAVRREHRCLRWAWPIAARSWSGWADSTNCFGGARTGISGSGSPGRACASAAFRARADGTAPRPTAPIRSGRPRLCSWRRWPRTGRREGRYSAARSSVIEARRASEVMRNQNSLARWASMAVTQVAERQVGKVPHVCAPASHRKVESIAFVSPHCLLDYSNGAAICDPRDAAVPGIAGFPVPGVLRVAIGR